MAAARRGVRVVRGPDWQSLMQDGGEGGLGTVIDIRQVAASSSEPGPNPTVVIVVQWDAGKRGEYKCSQKEGKRELRAFDTAPAGACHTDVQCLECREQNIYGIRWECRSCVDVNLCNVCYHGDAHDLNHVFSAIPYPGFAKCRAPVRNCAIQLKAEGFFPGAKVCRGPHWEYEDEDGGGVKTVGVVEKILNGGESSFRSIATVQWPNKSTSEYRIGYEGKVDLKCRIRASGGDFFPDHLPVLVPEAEMEESKEDESEIRIGSLVHIPDMELDILQVLQDTQSGWNDDIIQALGQVGEVIKVAPDNAVHVYFPSIDLQFALHPGLVSALPRFAQDDRVCMIEDKKAMRTMLASVGGWNDELDKYMGTAGKVTMSLADHHISVTFGSDEFIFHPGCLRKFTGEEEGEPKEVHRDGDDEKEKCDAEDDNGDLTDDVPSEQPPSHPVEGQVNYRSDDVSGMPSEPPPTRLGEDQVYFQGDTTSDMAATAQVFEELGQQLGVTDVRYIEVTDLQGNGVHGFREDDPSEVVDGSEHFNLQFGELQDGFAGRSAGESDDDQADTLTALDTVEVATAKSESAQEDRDGDGSSAAPGALKKQLSFLDVNRVLGPLASCETLPPDDESEPTILIAKAIVMGNAPELHRLVNQYPNNVHDRVLDYELSLLHVAASAGAADIAEYIHGCGVDLEELNKQRLAPIHIAVGRDDARMINRLHRLGATIDRQPCQAISPLHYGCWNGCQAAVAELLRLGVIVDVADETGDTPLHAAIRKNHGEVVTLLLEGGADARLLTCRNFNAVQHAAFFNSYRCIGELLERYADLLHSREGEQNTPLHMTSINNFAESTEILLKQPGIELDPPNEKRATPLMMATMQGCKSSVEQLVAYGADINAEDMFGDSVMHHAVAKYRMSSSALALYMAPDKYDSGEYSTTISEIEMEMGYQAESQNRAAAIACFLAREGCNLEYLNHNGHSPLDLCLDYELRQMLLVHAKPKGESKFHGCKAKFILQDPPADDEEGESPPGDPIAEPDRDITLQDMMPGESLPTLDNGQVDGGTVLDISDPVPVVAPEEPCEQLPCSHDTPAPAADGVPEPTDTNIPLLKSDSSASTDTGHTAAHEEQHQASSSDAIGFPSQSDEHPQAPKMSPQVSQDSQEPMTKTDEHLQELGVSDEVILVSSPTSSLNRSTDPAASLDAKAVGSSQHGAGESTFIPRVKDAPAVTGTSLAALGVSPKLADTTRPGLKTTSSKATKRAPSRSLAAAGKPKPQVKLACNFNIKFVPGQSKSSLSKAKNGSSSPAVSSLPSTPAVKPSSSAVKPDRSTSRSIKVEQPASPALEQGQSPSSAVAHVEEAVTSGVTKQQSCPSMTHDPSSPPSSKPSQSLSTCDPLAPPISAPSETSQPSQRSNLPADPQSSSEARPPKPADGSVTDAEIFLNKEQPDASQLHDAVVKIFATSQEDDLTGVLFLCQKIFGGDVKAVQDWTGKHNASETFTELKMAPLHIAALLNQPTIVRILVESGADLNGRLHDGKTALHVAAAKNHVEVIKVLLSVGADGSGKTFGGTTPLHTASMLGHSDATQILCDSGVAIEAQDADGDTALHRAVTYERVECISILLAAGAKCSIQNGRGFSCVHHASFKGCHLSLEKLLEVEPQLANSKMDEGYAPLHITAINNMYESVAVLVRQPGIDINITESGLSTPLALAVKRGHKACIELLVRNGADLNMPQADGNTCLHDACLLLSMCASSSTIDVDDTDGLPSPEIDEIQRRMSQSQESENKCLAIACYLASRGADIEYFNNKGNTPLELCYKSDLMEIVLMYSQSRDIPPSSHVVRVTESVPEPTPSSTAPLRNITTPAQKRPVKRVCCLCGSGEIAVRFLPCRHENMCTACSLNAVTCPEIGCKTRIAARELLSGVPLVDSTAEECILCESIATVVFEPCGHLQTCLPCCFSTSKCRDCRSPVKGRVSQDGGVEFVKTREGQVLHLPRTKRTEEKLKAAEKPYAMTAVDFFQFTALNSSNQTMQESCTIADIAECCMELHVHVRNTDCQYLTDLKSKLEHLLADGSIQCNLSEESSDKEGFTSKATVSCLFPPTTQCVCLYLSSMSKFLPVDEVTGTFSADCFSGTVVARSLVQSVCRLIDAFNSSCEVMAGGLELLSILLNGDKASTLTQASLEDTRACMTSVVTNLVGRDDTSAAIKPLAALLKTLGYSPQLQVNSDEAPLIAPEAAPTATGNAVESTASALVEHSHVSPSRASKTVTSGKNSSHSQHVQVNFWGKARVGKSCLIDALKRRLNDSPSSSTFVMAKSTDCFVYLKGGIHTRTGIGGIEQDTSTENIFPGNGTGTDATHTREQGLAGDDRGLPQIEGEKATGNELHYTPNPANGSAQARKLPIEMAIKSVLHSQVTMQPPDDVISLTICDMGGHNAFTDLHSLFVGQSNAVNVICFNAAEDSDAIDNTEMFVCPDDLDVIRIPAPWSPTNIGYVVQHISDIDQASHWRPGKATIPHSPPVILVGTHADVIASGPSDVPARLDQVRHNLWPRLEKEIQATPGVTAMSDRPASTHDASMLRLVSSVDGHSYLGGTDELAQLSEQIASAVRHVAASSPEDELPTNWQKLKAALQHLSEHRATLFDNKGFLWRDELQEVAEQCCGFRSFQDVEDAVQYFMEQRKVFCVDIRRSASSSATTILEGKLIIFDPMWLVAEFSRLLFGDSCRGLAVDEDQGEARKWLWQTGKLTKPLTKSVWPDLLMRKVVLSAMSNLDLLYSPPSSHGKGNVYLVPSACLVAADGGVPRLLDQFIENPSKLSFRPPALLFSAVSSVDGGTGAPLGRSLYSSLVVRLMAIWSVRAKLDSSSDESQITRECVQLLLPEHIGRSVECAVKVFLAHVRPTGVVILGLEFTGKAGVPLRWSERRAAICTVSRSIRLQISSVIRDLHHEKLVISQSVLPWPAPCNCRTKAVTDLGAVGFRIPIVSTASTVREDIAPTWKCETCSKSFSVPSNSSFWLQLSSDGASPGAGKSTGNDPLPPLCQQRLERAFRRCKPPEASRLRTLFQYLEACGLNQLQVDTAMEVCDELENEQLVRLLMLFVVTQDGNVGQPVCTTTRGLEMVQLWPRYFRGIALLEVLSDWMRACGDHWRRELSTPVLGVQHEVDSKVKTAMQQLVRVLGDQSSLV